MSPCGVLMTTALRVPMSALAMGTTRRVSSGSRSKRVAMSYGLESFSMVFPGTATSVAAGIPTGTRSIYCTSSTIGIARCSRLFMSTASSFWTMAPEMERPRFIARFRRAAASWKSTVSAIITIHCSSKEAAPISSSKMVVPTPKPCPPGVEGL